MNWLQICASGFPTLDCIGCVIFIGYFMCHAASEGNMWHWPIAQQAGEGGQKLYISWNEKMIKLRNALVPAEVSIQRSWGDGIK